jgi:Flp pilus assembly pilin Flp
MSDVIKGTWTGLATRLAREEGQALTEYALVIVLVAAIAGLVMAFDSTIATDIGNKITGVFK